MERHLQLTGGPIVDQEVLDLAKSQTSLKLQVYLTQQPGHEVAVSEKQIFQPQFDQLTSQVRELVQPFEIGKDIVPQAIKDHIASINRQRDDLLTDMRLSIYSRIKPQIQPQQERVISFVNNDLKGKVYAQVNFVNVLGVEIPSDALSQLAKHNDIAKISVDHSGGLELYTSARATYANYFWNNGYYGDSSWDVAVVDTGVNIDHPALQAHKHSPPITVPYISMVPGHDYPDDDNGHGTAIAGIIGSTDSTYKGISSGIGKILICKVADINHDPVETEVWSAVDWALDPSRSPYAYQHQSAEIINFSQFFTPGYATGYSDTAKFFDAVVDDLHVMVVKSAGNNGDPGYCTITKPGEMYNGLTVANMDDRDTLSRTDDVAATSSSVGPVANGRKKPDLIAPGVTIITTRRDYIDHDDFGYQTTGNGGTITISGTSFAAAHVTGAAALLYDCISLWPKTLKAILINTVDDWNNGYGVGWDKKHGWGYINLQKALTQFYYDEVGLNPKPSTGYQYYWSCYMNQNDKITVVWNREVDYNYPSSPTVYDLDNVNLYVYDYTGGVKGALLYSSTSTVDNVEQIVYKYTTQRQVLVMVENITTNSPAYVSVAFPGPSTRKGFGPYAPSRVINPDNKPIVSEVGQNFPNPFNPETWIPYAIAKDADVSVQIFDINGNLVRKLELGKKSAGTYFSREKSVYWDGRNESAEKVSSGVYFYYITAGDFAAARKMVIAE